jgi:hypothetical protein
MEGFMAADAWHRRHAIQIAAALPETREDALIVLEMARVLVEGYLFAPQPPELPLGRRGFDGERGLDGERVRGLVVSLSSAT